MTKDQVSFLAVFACCVAYLHGLLAALLSNLGEIHFATWATAVSMISAPIGVFALIVWGQWESK